MDSITVPIELQKHMMKTSELVPYIGNAKEHPDWQIEQIASSIRAYGFNDPISVWEDVAGHMVIVEGHGRLMAAKALHMEKVPVIKLDHLDDEGRRAYTLVHNQLTTNTGYDIDVLNEELANIEGFDMAEFGFDVASLDLASMEYEPMADEGDEDPQDARYIVLRYYDDDSYGKAVDRLRAARRASGRLTIGGEIAEADGA